MDKPDTYQVLSLERATTNCPSYHRWLVNKFEKFLGKRLLEIGSGSGTITRFLLKPGRRVFPSDIDSYFLKILRREYPQTLFLDITKPDFKKIGGFDTVVAANLLEHIEDDRLALVNMNRLLRRGGNLLVLVPAHMLLFGSYDRLLGHHRRYTKEELANKVRLAGFRIIKIFYISKLTSLGWLVNARILKLSSLPTAPFLLLEKLTPFLDLIDKLIPFDFGTSIICIARKTTAADTRYPKARAREG